MTLRHALLAFALGLVSCAWEPARALNGPPAGIDVWVFLHDNSGETDHTRFFQRYASWWMEDMRRRVTPGIPLRVHVYSRVPGITDMDYQTGRHADRMRDIRLRGTRHAQSLGAPVTPLTRFVLFVGEPAANWEPGWRGLASEFNRAAIASNQAPVHVFAHEIGHLLGARHEQASHEPCVTNMGVSAGTAPCLRYSDANAERILAYVRAVAQP